MFLTKFCKIYCFMTLSLYCCSSVISDFINCVPKVVGSSSTPLRVAKLKCIRKIAGSSLFKDRGELTPT